MRYYITTYYFIPKRTDADLALQEIPICCVSNIQLTCGNILKRLMITHVNVFIYSGKCPQPPPSVTGINMHYVHHGTVHNRLPSKHTT